MSQEKMDLAVCVLTSMFRLLDEYNEASRHVWNIVTALRGPDTTPTPKAHIAKRHTTAPFRGVFLSGHRRDAYVIPGKTIVLPAHTRLTPNGSGVTFAVDGGISTFGVSRHFWYHAVNGVWSAIKLGILLPDDVELATSWDEYVKLSNELAE